ncbi:alditol oxidase [soil metagenome]
MNKRKFLKTSSVIITGTMLAPLGACNQQTMSRRNWAGNYEYSTNSLLQPKAFEEAQKNIKNYSKLRILGSRHSFNGIADSTENQISSGALDQVVSLDENSKTVTVEGGMRYGELCTYLHNHGYALHNLASLPHISIAGACSTATHGSGVSNGNLATAVTALEVLTADGEVVSFSRKKDKEQFEGAVVSLGGLGLITKVTLEIQPTFTMEQYVYRNLPLKNLEGNFMEIMSGGYSVSLFTDWKNPYLNQVWVKKLSGASSSRAESEFFEASLATQNLHPIEEISAVNCTEQMGVPGPWHERLPHFRMNFTPSSGKELQSEFFVPRHHAVDAILAISRLGNQISPHLMISEIRTIAADQFWMSPCYNQDSVAIHFTWEQDWPAVRKLLPVIEKVLAPFQVRPHWGKLFTMTPAQLHPLYEKLPDFQNLLNSYDPKGKFRNEFMEVNIFGSRS